MRRISSAASPELQFSHPQTIYTSNSMITLSTKYRKAEKCETKMIIEQNTHLSGKGSEFIVRPKTKFTVKSFCFFGHTNIKYLILYSYVHFGMQWAKIDGGRRDTTGELFLRGPRRSASKIWLCLFGPISQPQPLENDARFARNNKVFLRAKSSTVR
jgi:hypothetical protein